MLTEDNFLITVVMIGVAISLITLGIWQIRKKWVKHKNEFSFGLSTFIKLIQGSLLIIVLGTYFILMIFGLISVLKITVPIMGLLFITNGVLDIFQSRKQAKQRHYSLLEKLVISFFLYVYPMFMILFGTILVYLGMGLVP